MRHEDSSAPVEDNENHSEPEQETEPEAIPLGPATQAIIIQSIN